MGLPFHPTHINRQNQRDRRHGYADLLRYPQRYQMHWRLWNGGTTRVLLWGDPDYVRRFAESARLYDGDSFDVNEMLATKMLGEPHDERRSTDPRRRATATTITSSSATGTSTRCGAALGYNPDAAPEVWEHEFAAASDRRPAATSCTACTWPARCCRGSWRPAIATQYFPTTRGWAEMKRQGDFPSYAGEDGSDIQQFMSLRDEAKSIVEGSDTAMRRPEETSRWFAADRRQNSRGSGPGREADRQACG